MSDEYSDPVHLLNDCPSAVASVVLKLLINSNHTLSVIKCYYKRTCWGVVVFS